MFNEHQGLKGEAKIIKQNKKHDFPTQNWFLKKKNTIDAGKPELSLVGITEYRLITRFSRAFAE